MTAQYRKNGIRLVLSAGFILPLLIASSVSAEESKTLVLDMGRDTVMAGFAGEDAPRMVMPAVVGSPKSGAAKGKTGGKEYYAGDEATSRRGILSLTWPLRDNPLKDWINVERLLHHVFYNEMRVAPEEQGIWIILPDGGKLSQYKMLLKILFETFQVPRVVLVSRAVTSITSSGRMTGLAVVMTGSGGEVVPVVNQKVLQAGVVHLPVGQDRLVEQMMKLLTKSGFPLKTAGDKEIARDITEKVAYVALDYRKELKRARGKDQKEIQKIYALPGGTEIPVKMERFQVPEALFQPKLVGVKGKGLPAAIAGSISKAKKKMRRTLWKNIVLAGSGSLISGLEQRLTKDLAGKAPRGTKPKVVAPPERKYSSWIGGSILAEMAKAQDWLTQKDLKSGDWKKKLKW